MKKRIGIYDPYLNTLGGGERYFMTIAEILQNIGYDVDIFWPDKSILSQIKNRFELNVDHCNVVPNIFQENHHNLNMEEPSNNLINVASSNNSKANLISKIRQLYERYKVTRKYDMFFYLSDWSIPVLFSSKNYLHIQIPFVRSPSAVEGVITYLKLMKYDKIICNSNFTRHFATSYFGSKTITLYPPVDTNKFNPSQNKQNIILSVGRFDILLNSKKQDVMIEAFAKLHSQNPHNSWRLIIAGGSLEPRQKNSYIKHLEYLSKDLPVEIVINPSFKTLNDLYSTAKLYWHAAGCDINDQLNPEKTEHFGIAPVEAMASGCVPLVTAKGGLPEIISDGEDGFLWSTTSQLIAKTQLLIASPDKINNMSKQAIIKSGKFSKEEFQKSLQLLINHG